MHAYTRTLKRDSLLFKVIRLTANTALLTISVLAFWFHFMSINLIRFCFWLTDGINDEVCENNNDNDDDDGDDEVELIIMVKALT